VNNTPLQHFVRMCGGLAVSSCGN